MAKEKALNTIKYGTEEKAELAEILDGVLENVQTGAISEQIKAKNGSGTPESGSVEYKRYANATLNDLGTARAAGKGSKVEEKPVIVNIDTDKEIVEEVAGKDLRLNGVAGMAQKRSANHDKRIRAYLDTKFFACGATEGTEYVPETNSTIQEKVDNLILTAKETKNDFIDGIDAEELVLVLCPSYRKALKNVLDELPNGTNPSAAAIGMYDSVMTYESTRLPAGVKAMVMMDGAIAQPYYVDETELEKIPLIDSYAIENFLHAGTKALMEDTIYYIDETAEVTPAETTV